MRTGPYDGLLDPRAERVNEGLKLAARPVTLDGATIGLLDNSKANAGHVLKRVEEKLKARFVIKGSLMHAKIEPPYSAGPASGEILGDLTKNANVVINALGD